MASLTIVVLLVVGAALAKPPCFGNVGSSRRGIDIGWNNRTGPFSSTHFSRWNYTIPAMRYDVFQHSLVDNSYTESNNLFYWAGKTMYSWDQNKQCVQCPAPPLNYECIPQTWTMAKTLYVAGQQVLQYVDNPDAPRNAQSATANAFGPTQWLVNILSFDDNANVKEAVQIQDFQPGVVEDPTALHPPAFCINAPKCKSIEDHFARSALPVFMRRRMGQADE